MIAYSRQQLKYEEELKEKSVLLFEFIECRRYPRIDSTCNLSRNLGQSVPSNPIVLYTYILLYSNTICTIYLFLVSFQSMFEVSVHICDVSIRVYRSHILKIVWISYPIQCSMGNDGFNLLAEKMCWNYKYKPLASCLNDSI